MFSDRMIEFCCKKGQHNHQNQDNFFCVVDGNTKIFGLFDGHGVNGHRVSAFVMGTMLDYVKNAKWFKEFNSSTDGPETIPDDKIKKGIRCCFKYV
jgi:serine/threonine protein phosphatase PrpC